jgi:hypothetical protein
MGETSKWTAQREMTLIEDMNCSFNRLIEKGNNLTAERDLYREAFEAADHMINAIEEWQYDSDDWDRYLAAKKKLEGMK